MPNGMCTAYDEKKIGPRPSIEKRLKAKRGRIRASSTRKPSGRDPLVSHKKKKGRKKREGSEKRKPRERLMGFDAGRRGARTSSQGRKKKFARRFTGTRVLKRPYAYKGKNEVVIHGGEVGKFCRGEGLARGKIEEVRESFEKE